MTTRNFGDYTFTPTAVYPSISAAASASSAPRDGWDYVVVTTKALPDVIDDAKEIEPIVRLAPDGKSCIVLIQNGVGVEEPHRKLFPNNPLVSGVTLISAEQIRNGVVKQNRWTRVSFGPYSDGVGGRTSAAMDMVGERGQRYTDELCRLLNTHGGLKDAESYDEVSLQQVRWHKICINAAMNPSSILAGGRPASAMALDPELRKHLKGIMDEVFEAAETVLGTPFPAKLAKPEQILKSVERNAGGRPSMLIDWINGRPMELEVILGNPVRIAAKAGFEMRRVQTLYALLKSAQTMRQQAETKGEKDMVKL